MANLPRLRVKHQKGFCEIAIAPNTTLTATELAESILAGLHLSPNTHPRLVGLISTDTTPQTIVPLSVVANNPQLFSSPTNPTTYGLCFQSSPEPLRFIDKIYSTSPTIIIVLTLAFSLALLLFTGHLHIDHIIDAAGYTIDVSLKRPLRNLYRKGPATTIFGADIGFWENRPLEEICSRIATGSSSSAHFWQEHQVECQNMFERKEDGFLLIAGVPIYLVVLSHAIALVIRLCNRFIFG
eukprot:c21343_g1_i1.p1 GENE.c21343_g1_i1~~c21343_g1_i1.p1  ORF type:complete len:252 (+),score=51.78 c21343_g1_i1:37-756(+)